MEEKGAGEARKRPRRTARGKLGNVLIAEMLMYPHSSSRACDCTRGRSTRDWVLLSMLLRSSCFGMGFDMGFAFKTSAASLSTTSMTSHRHQHTPQVRWVEWCVLHLSEVVFSRRVMYIQWSHSVHPDVFQAPILSPFPVPVHSARNLCLLTSFFPSFTR